MSREMALQTYRHLLRSTRIAFQGIGSTYVAAARAESHIYPGDMGTLLAARHEARKNFENGRNLAVGSEEMSKQITHAEEVAKFLKENVVQGQAMDAEGNYSE